MKTLQQLHSVPFALYEPYYRALVEAVHAGNDYPNTEMEKFFPKPSAMMHGKPGQMIGPTIELKDGIAIQHITGPVVRTHDFWSRMEGATSIDEAYRDLASARDNPAVKAIVLHMNTPGGEVDGTGEFAGLVHQTANTKPVIAYVSFMAASAGYWIASAAGEIVAAPTALLGSIGVVTTYYDTSKMMESFGIEKVEIVSSQSPLKRVDPKEEGGRAVIQREIDAIADVFINSVAPNRGVTRQTVLEDFGQGDVFVGKNAIKPGLADRIGTFEATLRGLQNGRTPRRKNQASSSARHPTPDTRHLSPDYDLAHPQI
ncbi:hypothetical protein CMI47_04295, partial [Candidatus Pacearchaeota archaeon]|nr:hypothetical protein [Candidatus Pacearchaeota archaeon]